MIPITDPIDPKKNPMAKKILCIEYCCTPRDLRTAILERFCLTNIVSEEMILKQAIAKISINTIKIILLVNSNDLKKLGFSLVQSLIKNPPPDSIAICLV